MTTQPPTNQPAVDPVLAYIKGIYQFRFAGPANAAAIGTMQVDGIGGGACTDLGDPGQKHFLHYTQADQAHQGSPDALGGIFYGMTLNFHPLSGLPTDWACFQDSDGNLHFIGQQNSQPNGWTGDAWK